MCFGWQRAEKRAAAEEPKRRSTSWTFLLGDLNERESGRAESVGRKLKKVGDQPIASNLLKLLKYVNNEYSPLHQMALFPRGVSSQNGRPSALGFGSARTARLPNYSLPTTSNFDYGSKVPATETSRRYPLLAEYRHRGHEPRERGLEPDTSQDCFRFRQHHSNDDQGTFSPPG